MVGSLFGLFAFYALGVELFAHRYRERPHRRAAVTHMFQEGNDLEVVVWHLDDAGRSRERRVEVGNKGWSLIPSPKGGGLVG